MERKTVMKTIYLIPTTEVMWMESEPLLQSVSGLGLNEGGEDDGSQVAQSPGRKPF